MRAAAFVLLSGCTEYAYDDVTPAASGVAMAPNPWDRIDPGATPADVFAIAFHDTSGVPNGPLGWGLWCLPADLDPYTDLRPVRYAVIDANGQILRELEPPFASFPRYDGFATLSATPDQRVLVTSRATEGDPRAWRSWLADAVDGETVDLVERAHYADATSVRFEGVEVDLGVPFYELAVVLDPIDRDLLWLARHMSGATPTPLDEPLLWALRRSTGQIAASWSIRDLAPPALLADPNARLTARGLAAVDADGQTQLVLDSNAFGEPATPASERGWQRLTLVFEPSADALRWVFDREARDAETYDAGLFASRGGVDGLLFEEPRPDDVFVPTDFRVYGTDRSVRNLSAADLACNTPLALLDAAAPTFAWAGHPTDDGGAFRERISISHRGGDVWAIDALRDGVSTLPVDVRGFAWAGSPR